MQDEPVQEKDPLYKTAAASEKEAAAVLNNTRGFYLVPKMRSPASPRPGTM